MSNFRNFLVVPSSRWQLGLIKYLKKLKLNVFTLDDNLFAEGHKYSDGILNIKTKNISKIKKFCKQKKLFPISCSSDFGFKIVNKIQGQRNNFFNKLKQRKIQKKLGINTPLFFDYKNFNKQNFSKCKKKVISKPIIGSGSNDVKYHEKFVLYKDKNIFYEEFIEGNEYNIEGLVYNKKIFIFSIMKKKKFKKSKTVSYLLKKNSLSKKILNNLENMIKKFILKSKYPNGPFHIEVIVQKNTNIIYIVEGHPREAGFDMFFFTCKVLTGIDLYKLITDVKLKKKIDINLIKKKKKYTNFCCRMVPFNKDGKLKKIYFKKFNDKRNVKTFVKIFFKKNDIIINKNNDASRMAYIQSFSNDNKINLEKYTLNILNKYFVSKFY